MMSTHPTVNGHPPTLLSIVMPVHNEREVLPMTHRRVTEFGPKLAELGFDYELILVNDGSYDGTTEILDGLAASDPRVRVAHLTRNFGHQAAVTAGLTLARGGVIAVMDADLQDPPEVLPSFLAKWREGYQVVYAIRMKRKEWFGKRLAYWAFYRLLAAISEIQMPLDSGDFCVMDRSALDLLNGLPERQRFVRGLRTWIGLKQVGVAYERDARAAGVPQYTMKKLLKLAADGLVSFSSTPLRMMTRMGMFFAFLSGLFLLWVIVDALFDITEAPPGWASTACLIMFVGAVQMISMGVLGEYIARIFLEVKGRPTFLIARVEGGEGSLPRPGMPAARESEAV